LFELRRLKEETMKCNIIAQRISLQEFLIEKEPEIMAKIEYFNNANNEEETKSTLTPEYITDLFKEWLGQFTIT
jgi:hypothetical protein